MYIQLADGMMLHIWDVPEYHMLYQYIALDHIHVDVTAT